MIMKLIVKFFHVETLFSIVNFEKSNNSRIKQFRAKFLQLFDENVDIY